MGVSVQFRRGTAAAWTAADPTLLPGEVGFETDTNKFKIGDGVTAWTVLAYVAGDVTGSVLKTDYHANTILKADADHTPEELEIGVQEVLGRLTGGEIDGIAIGIADDNIVQIDGADIADNEYARFTANGLESRTAAEVKTDLGVGIADNNLLEVDDASAADNEFARFTANGIEGLTVAEAITALLGASLPENVSLDLDDVLSADGKYTGICIAGVAGATLAFGDVCYLASADGRWELAKADAAATASAQLGICVLAAANDGDVTKLLLFGTLRADTAFPDLTKGAPVYLDYTNAGDVVVTLPAKATGRIVRILGYGGKTKEEMTWCPDNTYLEYA